jgi:hypothetical protein
VNGAETFSQHNWLDCNPNPDACSPQNGTWQFDRAGWCPGTIAPWFDFDMTPFVAGDDVELKYILNENYTDLCHANNPNCVSGVTCDNCNDGFNPHLITASYLISLGDNPIDQPAVSTSVNNIRTVDFDIYPNPSSGTFTVAFDAAIEVEGIRVLNNLGQVVRVFNDDRNTTVRILHLEDMPKGIYFVELLSVKGMGMKKVVIE